MDSAVKQMNTRRMNNIVIKISSLLCALSVLLFALCSCSSSGTTSEKSFYISAAQRAVVLELDNDDYRYDFAIGRNGKSGPGTVCRFRAVYHQLADGVNMATKEEAAKKIKCDFQRTAKGYSYTITFGQRYIEPIVLRKGFAAGFGMFLHDRDDASLPSGIKGLSLATEPGSHCDYKPHLWPLMILAE